MCWERCFQVGFVQLGRGLPKRLDNVVFLHPVLFSSAEDQAAAAEV